VEAVGRVVGLALILGLVCASCGSNGNDQGSSFRAVGIFQGTVETDKCTAPVANKAIADQSIALQLNAPFIDTGFPNASTGFFLCRGYIWLENNLVGQAIAVDRIDFDYEIPGAHIAIPASSSVVGFSISPVDADPKTVVNPFGQVNIYLGHLEGQLVPASLVLFLRQNQPSLPELPYNMVIHITARGRTDSGDLLVTNEIRYSIQWTQ
jgi:hypothetical protein